MGAPPHVFSQGPKPAEAASPPQPGPSTGDKGNPAYHFCSHLTGKSKSQGKVYLQEENGKVQSDPCLESGEPEYSSTVSDYQTQACRKTANWPRKGRFLDNLRRKVNVIIFCPVSYLSTKVTYFYYWGDSFTQ